MSYSIRKPDSRKPSNSIVPIVPVYKSSQPIHMPEEYRANVWPLWFVAFAFLHNRRFGALFVLGLVVEVVLQSSGLI